jgi:hypothetical protein
MAMDNSQAMPQTAAIAPNKAVAVFNRSALFSNT